MTSQYMPSNIPKVDYSAVECLYMVVSYTLTSDEKGNNQYTDLVFTLSEDGEDTIREMKELDESLDNENRIYVSAHLRYSEYRDGIDVANLLFRHFDIRLRDGNELHIVKAQREEIDTSKLGTVIPGEVIVLTAPNRGTYPDYITPQREEKKD